MDKKAINVEELIKELRLKHRAYVETCSPNAGQIFADAADVLEQMHEMNWPPKGTKTVELFPLPEPPKEESYGV